MDRWGLAALLALLALGCAGGIELRGDGDEDDAARDGAAEGPTDAGDPRDIGPDVPAESSDDAAADVAHDADGDRPDSCAPQRAEALGTCGRVLPGVVWNGSHCVPLGSGCACGGDDCASLYDTVGECVAARRACYAASCEPQAVWDSRCDYCEPDGAMLLGVFWDGRRCFELAGCSECVGEACAGAFASVEECDAVHSGCDAVLCRESGGEWYSAGADPCRFTCGLPDPPPGICDPWWGPCNCGPGRTWVPHEGCRDDDDCNEVVLCRLSGGSWHPELLDDAWFHCGRSMGCDADGCRAPCDCGLHRNFEGSLGCVPDLACWGTDAASVCLDTGGTPAACDPGGPCACRYDCGVPQSVCTEPGCDCGPFRNFDEALGCAYDPRCVLRGEGDTCAGGPRSTNCRPGLVCCTGCGVPLACPYCRPPCCPDDASCMDDGCPVAPP